MNDQVQTPASAGPVDTCAICDVAKHTRVMSDALRCRSANPNLRGPALTVRCRDDFFGLILAIEQAKAGDVIVVDGGGSQTALAGELFARAALARGVAGIIVDAAYRDLAYVATCELPIYSRHTSPMAGATQRLGVINEPVTCGGVTVCPGDLVIADHDGIVVLDPATAPATLAAAAQVKHAEARIIEVLATGAGLRACLNVDEHAAALASGQASTLRVIV
ncbi:RraA family protein [Rhizocola hellebori]|uniref:RraA family protein n=1 Tax=Rhizocola hellebori TaxID=1392758 RepID=UPI001EF1FF3A|nr:RraA family protein [Rhizocola hellebori]